MSNPVTNVEVEDVLSSIRRLVSDDKRPAGTSKSAQTNDRLVLTPALRVAEMNDDSEEDNGETNSHPWSEFGAGPNSDIAEEKIKQESQKAEEAEELETLLAQNERAGDSEHATDDLEAMIGALNEAPENIDIAGDGGETQEASETSDAARDEAHVPFVLEPTIEPDLLRAESVHEGNDEDDADQSVTEIPEAEAVETQSEAAFFASSAKTLGAKIAALETVIGKTDEQWEPDDTGDSDYSGTEAPAMEWDDASAVESKAPAETDTPSTETGGGSETRPSLSNPVEDFLDEDALRDLVSDIVREELQGALGERITRNVRKLVRREIHRALAAQELE